MKKIASPDELVSELQSLLAYASGEHPSREKLASGLRELAAALKTADVGRIILDQMGGARRLAMMLGIKKFQTLPRGVGFQWPNKQRSRGNYVEIILQPSDTYDMTFFNLSARGKRPVKKFNDVYADQLVELFEGQTGWHLRMATYDRLAGYSYGVDRMTVLFVPGRRPVPFNRDVIDAIYQTFIPLGRGEDGSLSVSGHQSSGIVNRIQERQGYRQTTRVDIQFPKGTDRKTLKALQQLGKKMGFSVEPFFAGHKPEVREP